VGGFRAFWRVSPGVDNIQGWLKQQPFMNDAESQESHAGSPLVSVIIPAYRAARHIASAIDSVLAQTFPDHEIIVINDGSPDIPQLLEVLRPYRSRIRYLEQTNQGPSGARNTGIRAALGTYVAFLDSDDCWSPPYLDEQIRLLEGPPPCDLVYSNAQRVGPLAGRWPTCMDASPSNGPVNFESLIREQCTVLTSFAVARRQSVLDAGLFDPAFRRSEDFDLWLRMAHRGAKMNYQRTVLGTHALSEEGLSGDRDALREGQLSVYRKTLATMDLSAEESALIRAQLERCQALIRLDEGKHLLISRRYHEAATAFSEANVFYKRISLRATQLLLGIMPAIVRWLYLISLRSKTGLRHLRSRASENG
jgi:glycosyltransferase involved in cell wall biosynthesis